jgi:hypothetical protein
MKTSWGKLPGAVALAVGAWLLAGSIGAGQDKEKLWKPVVPDAAFQQLLHRQTKAISTALLSKDKDDHTTALVNTIRVAALALSVKGGEVNLQRGVRETSLQVAHMIKENKDLTEASKLAASLPFGRSTIARKPPDLSRYIEVADLMNLYQTKKKGGEGIAPALQSTGPLKKQNGIEEKVRYLAKKALKPAVLEKESAELALLGYEMAADGALTATFAPAQKKGPAEWRELSLRMRDAAVQLAEAASKKDAAAVHTAATSLDAACTRCHSRFRQK